MRYRDCQANAITVLCCCFCKLEQCITKGCLLRYMKYDHNILLLDVQIINKVQAYCEIHENNSYCDYKVTDIENVFFSFFIC